MTRGVITSSLVALILLAAFAAVPVHAEGTGTYTVQPGDTLVGVAARFGVRVSQLAAANGLRWNSWVYVGQRLVIPGSLQTPTAPSGSAYIVKPGDTLHGIAYRHRTTVAALLAANGLSNPNFIYSGQRLVIPGGIGSPTSPTPSQPAPAPSRGYEKKWIDVNLTTQTLIGYEGQTPVFQTLVSTGTWGTPTVAGTYSIYVKHASALMTGPGYYLPNVPYIMYFYRGYGVHGTYWHSNFGTPMSHGCINMSVPDAQWLFNWASVGTTIVTHY